MLAVTSSGLSDNLSHQRLGLPSDRHFDSKTIFLLGLLVSATGLVSPPIALLAGIAFGFAVSEHPLKAESVRLSRLLLQTSVVALGFGMNLHEVIRVGASGFAYTAIGICTAIGLGLLLGRLLAVKGRASLLITIGTAICGGSAIAAVSPIAEAGEEEISVSMGTVFLLNSLALFLFPAVGHLLHLEQSQFGLWAALAIHDTSSVVGASAAFGAQALAIGTTVKLARALWIVPVSLVVAMIIRRKSGSGEKVKAKMPWFIALFCVAAAANTYLPRLGGVFGTVNHLGKVGLTATLFLIGTGLSKKTLREVGVRPLLQGVVLWVIVASASLAAIYFKLIAV